MMINLFNCMRKWQSRMWHIWILFVFLATTACQPAPAATPSIQPFPSKIPTAEPTSTESAVIPLPALDVTPTATLPLIVAESTSTLTPSGPWLAYLQYGLTIVNQDGTGRTILGTPNEFPVCDDGAGIQENPLNQLVIFPRTVYLVQPDATWTLIYREWPTCHTDFTGNEKGGRLAGIYESTLNGPPEVRIYELPNGKLGDHFPLMQCSEQCNTDNVGSREIKWSPNGRYLAFPAVLDGPSSDLYVYDTEDGSIRRLTSGPDDVGTIWWSPDGSQIIMGEIHENNYPYTSSLWVVSVSGNDVRQLYSLGESPYPQGLLGWLDDRRFIVYDGTTLANALDLPAYNLRVVDKDTGEITTLFNGSFMSAILAAPYETVVFHTNDEEPREGFEGPGIYMVSTSNPQLRIVRDVRYVRWDSEVGLFVTDDPCESDPEGLKGFNYRGEWQCVRRQLPPESFSSPDGQWQVSLQNGFWLKTNDGQPIQINEETVTQIIWRLDSKGIFFISNQVLYYVSLPELDIKIVDEYPGGDTIIYQWVSNN